jgi:hypothetical protein
MALGENRERFILTGNGESDLARALAPMVDLVSANTILIDVAAHLLSFLPTNSQKSRSHGSYEKQLEDTKSTIDEIKASCFNQISNAGAIIRITLC